MQQKTKQANKAKTTLSVVLATHNEAANLARCLEPIQSLANEIIIVDGESTDNTIAIAKSFKATIIQTTNKANFHINKQMAMDAATGTLVLQLDADEVIDTEALLWLTGLLAQTPASLQKQKTKAWYFRRRNYLLGRFMKKGGQYPDPVIRLYCNGFARLPAKDVHEQMVVDGNTETAAGHLLHYSNPTFQVFIRKWNDYTSLKATQLAAAQTPITVTTTLRYTVWLPLTTFLSLYIRHKGFMDGMAGFVFASMSGLYHLVSYLKVWELYTTQEKNTA